MPPRSQGIEASLAPGVKDLRSLFEQKAKESPANSGGSLRPGNNSVLFGTRQSLSRRSSPTPLLDDQAEFGTPNFEQSPPDQSSLRKRPPPPPPPPSSRGPKQPFGSPSPSASPLPLATSEQANAPENRSPPSVKQRLAARPPPPLPDFRVDQPSDAGLNSDIRATVDESPTTRG
ncbi:hypothetical protein F5148DRAFT_733295 [Russula earlei]|uniref:Uncharacterized protein n=1 Tax=Russula earlei TaxID=71964 RepID=A0ACC0UN75_9AGAM|nr:hypothetical protein F5148DRAFT_733295 [Russula earlei]